MSEIVAACVSQFHNDENSFELLLAYSDGREVGHSVSRAAARRIATELVNAVGCSDAKDAEISKLRDALLAAKEVVDVAEGMTSCRSDDDFIWSAQKKIDAALDGGSDAP